MLKIKTLFESFSKISEIYPERRKKRITKTKISVNIFAIYSALELSKTSFATIPIHFAGWQQRYAVQIEATAVETLLWYPKNSNAKSGR